MSEQPRHGGMLRVVVVVMGDLPRSPRMRNHIRSLLERGAEVEVICQLQSEVPTELAFAPRLRIHALPTPALDARHRLPRPLFITYTALRLLRQGFSLLWTLLMVVERPHWLLLQNPPAIPVLALTGLAARLRRARVMVDWHNLGYSLLALKLGRKHPLVRWARAHELRWGRRASHHLCVSRVMATELRALGMGPVTVFHDHPPERFAVAASVPRQELWSRLDPSLPAPLSALIERPAGRRPALMVSSSSWTADEDFDLLLDALQLCAGYFHGDAGNPALVVLLTGSGARRQAFEARVAGISLGAIQVHTAWLPDAAYPALLAYADLGLSLHRSSSGLDIPMKVIDMLGSGLPVAALDYGPPLREALHPGENALLFTDAAILAGHLRALFAPDGRPSVALERLREGVRRQQPEVWRSAWEKALGPLWES